MPRDGSGTYSQPFPPVTEGTTIESTVYNGYTADVSIDLNSPRPISTGGTGANNAADAMSNLGGEGSKIEVLNYDSHNFTAGSFYSKASATNPPIASHAFAGICYVAVVSGIATSDMFIEVRDRDEATQPGSLYVRQKKNGTWSGWLKAVGTAMSPTPPAAPTDGMLWWDPTQGKLFVWYSDPNTAQWVEAVATPDLGPDDFVSVDVAQSFTEAEKKTARSNIYAAPFDALAYNGMQVNGSMEVSQEGITDIALVSGTSKYIVDGWQFTSTGVQVAHGAPNVGAPYPGLPNCLQIYLTNANTSPAAGDYCGFFQFIEGYRIRRLAWGSASAQPITLGFWVQAVRTGVYSGAVNNGTFNRSYPFTFTVNAAGVWEFKTITIPGDTGGTWITTNGIGMTIRINMMVGSTYSGSPNAWAATGYIGATGAINGAAATSDTMLITGVVVLPGLEAPSAARSPLIMRPYDQELTVCKRYWQKLGGGGGTDIFINGYCAAGQGLTHPLFLPVELRAQPTSTIVGTWTLGNTSAVTINGGATKNINLQALATATGQTYAYTTNATCFITLDARL